MNHLLVTNQVITLLSNQKQAHYQYHCTFGPNIQRVKRNHIAFQLLSKVNDFVNFPGIWLLLLLENTRRKMLFYLSTHF